MLVASYLLLIPGLTQVIFSFNIVVNAAQIYHIQLSLLLLLLLLLLLSTIMIICTIYRILLPLLLTINGCYHI